MNHYTVTLDVLYDAKNAGLPTSEGDLLRYARVYRLAADVIAREEHRTILVLPGRYIDGGFCEPPDTDHGWLWQAIHDACVWGATAADDRVRTAGFKWGTHG